MLNRNAISINFVAVHDLENFNPETNHFAFFFFDFLSFGVFGCLLEA